MRNLARLVKLRLTRLARRNRGLAQAAGEVKRGDEGKANAGHELFGVFPKSRGMIESAIF